MIKLVLSHGMMVCTHLFVLSRFQYFKFFLYFYFLLKNVLNCAFLFCWGTTGAVKVKKCLWFLLRYFQWHLQL